MESIFIIFEDWDHYTDQDIIEVVRTEAEAKAFVQRYNDDPENYETTAYYDEWPIGHVEVDDGQ